MRTLAFVMALGFAAPALAAEPGPPTACVTAVYDAMTGTWGTDDETFVENHIPVTAWHIIPQDGDIVAMLTNGEQNVWFLTEHGADWTHDLRNRTYEGLFNATELLACHEGGDGQPAILETRILAGRAATRLRHRIELTEDRLLIQQFDRRDRLVSEQRLRRYTVVAIDPPPAPPAQP